MKEPNFFIVGAARSGTTALWHYLKEQPQVFMPKDLESKEPAFFSELKKSRFNKFEDYMKLFEDADEHHKWVGEASTAYLTDPDSAQRIYAYNPKAKIIILLRNPVHRAYSLYNWMVQSGHEYAETFEEALELETKRIHKEIPNYFEPEYYYNYLYFHSGLYYEQVKRFINLFKGDILIIKFENYIKDFHAEYNKISGFLGIQPVHITGDTTNESKRVYTSVVQFILRKITRFYFSRREFIEGNIDNKNALKNLIFSQVQKEINMLSTVKPIRSSHKARIYYLAKQVINKVHARKIILNKNTLEERDALMRLGYQNKKLKKMNSVTYGNLMSRYSPGILKLSRLTGIKFSNWDQI